MEVEVGAKPHDGYSVQASTGFLDQALPGCTVDNVIVVGKNFYVNFNVLLNFF